MRYLLPFLLLLSCAGNPQPKVPEGASSCAAAQDNLTKLHCPNGQGGFLGDANKHGVAFVDVCKNLYAESVDYKAPCFAAATNCTEVDACRP